MSVITVSYKSILGGEALLQAQLKTESHLIAQSCIDAATILLHINPFYATSHTQMTLNQTHSCILTITPHTPSSHESTIISTAQSKDTITVLRALFDTHTEKVTAQEELVVE